MLKILKRIEEKDIYFHNFQFPMETLEWYHCAVWQMIIRVKLSETSFL